MPVNLSDYRDLFVKTGIALIHEYDIALGKINELSALEKETYLELRRITHSLKGQSLAMNYKKLGSMWYRLERLFAHCVDQSEVIDKELFQRLPTIQQLEAIITASEGSENEAMVEDAIQKLDVLLGELGIVVTEL